MNNDDIVLRQKRLLVRSSQLRVILADQTRELKQPFSWVDQARSSMDWLRKNPQWSLGAVLVLTVLRPRAAMRWGSRLWWGWQTFRRVRHWLEKNPLRI